MTAAPVRLRLSRAKGFNLQAHSRAVNGLEAVKVDRSTRWGNRCIVHDSMTRMTLDGRVLSHQTEYNAAVSVAMFRRFTCTPEFIAAVVEELRGKNLACWCALDAPCHADVLLEIANHPICEAV